MIRLVLLLLALAIHPARAELALLRPLASVDDAVIRLGDLFDNAGTAAGRSVGPAPAPGRRVVVEAAQLHAIARANGLAWRPLSANETAVVERPGRALSREEVTDLLRAELTRLGLEPRAELEMAGFAPPMVPPAAFVQLTLEAAVLDGASGRFAATLVTVAEGMATQRMRLAGRALPTVAVVTATRRIGLGETIRVADLRVVRQRAERVRPGLASDPEEVVGKASRRPMMEGQPVSLADLQVPALIERNALVTMVLEAPGLTLTAQGRAMEAAARGQVVPVMNLASRSVVEAEAIGPGRVRVAPGSAPRR